MNEEEARQIVTKVVAEVATAHGQTEEAITRAVRARCIADAYVMKAFVTIGLIAARPSAA
ncbi:hypothetical protein QCE62_07025 [Caballeronia sp. LZ033]|uniref:hypothetical protein n=1 Tax=Caballeronia sp. LZ033 TaxID=3038566 RepID=UPI002856DD0E|nr:hypothetical protein [Caballeronia sp. LZ033]MDR5813344.1 hypothetical protein [Caballeronia sp. LZ033]